MSFSVILGCFALMVALTFQPNGLSASSGSVVPFQSHAITLTNLRNTVTNFGSFGSPDGLLPSCEWEAGSNNFYLNDGELWVGAVVPGNTAVTTGRFSGQEWSPVEEISVMPMTSAFSDEDTYTRYFDLEESLGKLNEHYPLGIQISQRTYAWEDRDFIVHDLLVENVGPDDLTDVYVGFCWDFNIASAAGRKYNRGDLVGLYEAGSISYMFDADGDKGLSPGYVGGKFINTPLAGHCWWSERQDPANDLERYERLSGGLKDDPRKKRDYRLLQSAGPFNIPAGGTIPLLYVLAIGDSLGGLIDAIGDAEEMLGLNTAAEGDSTLNQGEIDSIAVTLEVVKRALPRAHMAVDWEFCEVGFILVNPRGEIVTPEAAQSNPFVSFVAGPHHKSYDITDPLLGDWTLVISFISSDSIINYDYSVVLSDLPYDFGIPMEYFKVAYAQIVFGDKGGSHPTQLDSFEVRGDMELKAGSSFNHDEDPVIVTMGPYEEIIPPGSFEVVGPPEDETYHYSGSSPGIRDMTLDFYSGWFDVWAGQVDLTGIVNPVLVRLAIGSDTGVEEILCDEYPTEWIYDTDKNSPPKLLHLDGTLPGVFSLSQNYPNPFNATTQISYSIPQEARVLLAIYNVRGQQVSVLLNKEQSPGAYQVTWDGRDAFGNQAASGIYFCHLRAGARSQTRKMLLLR
jgi:hypothetical protein